MLILGLCFLFVMFYIGFKITGAILSAIFWVCFKIPFGLVIMALGLCFCVTIILFPIGKKLFVYGFKLVIPGI